MKDYLYIPLGGNRVTKRRLYFNLWFVFLISGLWHGAAWNFVIWGAFHGLFLIADRLFLLKFYSKIGKVPSIIITFLIVLVSWTIFRADNISHAWVFIQKMFTFDFEGYNFYFDNKFYTIMIFAVIFSFWGAFRGAEKWQDKLFNKEQKFSSLIIMSIISVILVLICVSSITSSGFNPFIYFRF
jgi:alginate O-acetyltransferase complex protein AlgI